MKLLNDYLSTAHVPYYACAHVIRRAPVLKSKHKQTDRLRRVSPKLKLSQIPSHFQSVST